jgi:very-short-patch-repair endonuclease
MPKNLTTTLILLMVVGLAVTMIAIKSMNAGRRRARGDIRARKLLTNREQAMFHRLQQAFPEHIVLTQVAFSALITAKDLPTRATFNRKVADFVLASKAFDVVAVIELDDASHRGREDHDRGRDILLERAGYRVMRFKNVPDVEAVQLAVRPPIAADPALRI